MIACASLFLLITAGCQKYKLDVILNEDGGGTRREELDIASIDRVDSTTTIDDVKAVFSIDENLGWKELRVPSSDADTDREGYAYVRENVVKNASGWKEISGGMHIRGDIFKGSFKKIEVEFKNYIDVTIAEIERGKSYLYKERFHWKSLIETINLYLMKRYSDQIAEAYPFLGKQELSEIQGVVIVSLNLMLEAEFSGEDSKEMAERMEAAIIRSVAEIVLRKRPDADTNRIEEITHDVFSDPDDKFGEYIRLHLPGVYMSVPTEIVLRVTMPGRIVDSNADEVEGNTAFWELDVMAAIMDPVEIFVKSELAK
jgi:hypothetical protein